MKDPANRAVAIVGMGAVLPDAPNAPAFWENVKNGRYSVSEVSPERWDPNDYYDPDPKAPDKSYTKIGGWVREWEWDPIAWRMPIPPRVGEGMDLTQKWAILCAREALADYGYPGRKLDPERTAVILGNAMGGDMHLYSAARILFPEFRDELDKAPTFADLPEKVRAAIVEETKNGVMRRLPPINEDTMPGELANIVAGRVASLFDFRGPNYIADAACASTMAAVSSAIEGLTDHDFDAVVTGGVDANMAPSIFVKFCKIGALSATGSRPYAEGADGFVMGEGGACFIMKRLEDAERDGDRIYAVIRSVGGSSDGRGKGITAPNPVGQRLAVERAWYNAGLTPRPGDLIEGHGTSTRVGDVAEVESMTAAFTSFNLPAQSVALGSVKSNIGHLKGAAGAAGMLKTAYALHHKMLPPSINFEKPNPNIEFERSPFRVNTSLREWDTDGVRRAGISAFGFGGTNFHVVMEEYVPGRLQSERREKSRASRVHPETAVAPKLPPRGALVVGARTDAQLLDRVRAIRERAEAGEAPPVAAPLESDLRAPVRVAIDYGNAEELAGKASMAIKALEENDPGRWKALRAKGVHMGRGPAPKVAFLFTGQGSQYVNMLRDLRDVEPIVTETYDEADRVMEPLLGKKLTDYIFVDDSDEKVVAEATDALKQTEITQPAVLATETALARVLESYGVKPDMVMGHSLGEYGALVAAGALEFPGGLRAVSARGGAMTQAAGDDNGLMAAAWGPIEEIEKILEKVDGYVVVANINSTKEAVIGGATEAVKKAMEDIRAAGYTVTQLTVSHAFHTEIVAAAADSLGGILREISLKSPQLPIVANITGEFYPMGPGVEDEMVDILARQVASPVQFVKGLNTLYDAGARLFIELGPKRALYGFATDVVGSYPDAVTLFTNHPRIGDVESFNQALCGLYAAGLGVGAVERAAETAREVARAASAEEPAPRAPELPAARRAGPATQDTYLQLGKMFADVLDRGYGLYAGREPARRKQSVCVTGASVGLPGLSRIFDEKAVESILRGDQFIDVIPMKIRRSMADKNVTRLVKDDRDARFETIDDVADVVKLAARGGGLDLVEEYGFPEDRVGALDFTTKLAIAAGIDALRDAGIPLVMRYKTTTTGTKLPERWMLPEEMWDDTGVIFASAFPGFDAFAQQMREYHEHRARVQRLEDLEGLRSRLPGGGAAAEEIERRVADLRSEIDGNPFRFDRRFLFRVLAMAHSQFAEYIGARGPNAQVNGACASTTQATSVAKGWIDEGRCRRVVVVSADNITTDNLLEWFGAGFLASGAAATDEVVEDAAIPFDRRRHGLIIGMGGAALVMETWDAAAERGIQPICEVLETTINNSAFHGTRLDVEHICSVMEKLIADAERDWGINRYDIAPHMVFVSHETYTPARGGSAAAEILALRRVFGSAADQIVIANTKGATGHPMGVGIEDSVAVKILETGLVPPVPNFKEVDPELGRLNLSKGGRYPVEYALRLAAGFGSQIGMSLLRRVPAPGGVRRHPSQLGYAYRVSDEGAWRNWLVRVTGNAAPEVEVVKRTLRVRDDRLAAVAYAPAAAASVPERTPSVEPTKAVERAPEVAPPPAPAADAVQERVMQIIAEKSGYPVDMLELDLDLEADLGIDTVKQAEMFAAIREAYDIPRDENLKLRDFPTLAHAVQFVYDRRPDLAAPRPSPTPAPVETAAAPSVPEAPEGDDPVRLKVIQIIAEQSGYPADMLDLDLDLEADLGIDTVKQAEMFAAIREEYGIPRDENLKLRDFPTLADTIRFVYERRPDLRPAAEPAAAPAVVPEAPVPPAPAVAATGSESLQRDDVEMKVVEIVAEKTGYPADMLDLDLDLEADLGVDTVKQAEMFAAIREVYGIPRDENLKLRDFPTLADTVRFVYERRPDLSPGGGAASAAPVAVETPAEPEAATTTDVETGFPRRVPVAQLRPGVELCKPTGVVLDSGSRVVVVPDRGGVGAALISRLEKRGVTVLVVDDEPDAAELENRIQSWKFTGPIHGVFWLPALDVEGEMVSMDIAAWREATRVRVKLLYRTMRALGDSVGPEGTFLVSATRLGGRHGYDERGAFAPMGGAVTGFTKAFKRECPSATVKAVDFEPGRKTAAYADLLIDETLNDPGVLEVGYADGFRWTIGLEGVEVSETGGVALGSDSVFVVTGAAGSIVSAIVTDLAAASGGTFHLLDLSPEPARDDPDIRRFAEDKEGLKRDIYERLKGAESGQRVTPATVERELAHIERSHAALSAIEAVERAGGKAYYHAVDLLDADAVARVMGRVRETAGRVDVLIHGAGVEISHLLADKKPQEFDLVFDVKSDGWFNVLSNLGAMDLGSVVVFSSIAGRFGNAAQTDYSAANDLLCKYVSNMSAAHRCIAIDWTAWSGIGMASRGSIPAVMKQARIDMLPAELGVPIVRRELTGAGRGGEVIVAGSLGVMVEEFDDTGGIDVEKIALSGGQDGSVGIMTGRVTGMGLHSGLCVETTLDPGQQPFLYDHQIDGTPVLPGVMGIEALVEAARLVFPERFLSAVEDVNFLVPFKFYRGEPRAVTAQALFQVDGDDVVARCRLVGTRSLHGKAEPETTTHFTARVRLSPTPPSERARHEVPAGDSDKSVRSEDIYKVYFHGPAYRVVEESWRRGDELVGVFAGDLPANHEPPDRATLASPRWIELCFQTAGIMELAGASRMGLPYRIGEVKILRSPDAAKGRVVAAVTSGPDESFDAQVVDEGGDVLMTVRGYRTMALPNLVSPDLLEPLKRAMEV